MATIAQFNQDQNNPTQPGVNSGGGGQVLNSAGGGASASSPPTATQARSTQASTPNINQYLQANQGAGQQLASGIQSNVQNQANQLNQNVNTAQNTLNDQYNSLNQNLGAQGQQSIQTAFQNPQQLLDAYNASKTQSNSQPLSNDQQNSLNQYNQFQQLNNGGYNQDISNYGQAGQQAQNNLQNQYQNLAQQTGQANTEMGQFQLLQNAVGQPNYNQGQQSLDQLFLQATPGVKNQLKQNLTNVGNQAQQNVQGFSGDTQSKLAALQGLSSQDQQLAKNMFGGGLNDIGQNVQNEYNALAKSAPANQASIQEAFQKNNFTPDQLQQLGLHSGEQTWGLSAQDLMNAGNLQNNALLGFNQGGAAQAANANEFARYNALNQLAGGSAGNLNPSIFGSASAAGNYNPVSFDSQALQNTINTRQQNVNKTDLLNALSSVAANTNSQSMLGPVQQIQAGVQAGTMTPEQANQLLQSQRNTVAQVNGANSDQVKTWDQLLNPFTNYYNNEYAPAAASEIGVTNPTATPLPWNPNDNNVDWSKIARPQGK